jgi:hypothetical protein
MQVPYDEKIIAISSKDIPMNSKIVIISVWTKMTDQGHSIKVKGQMVKSLIIDKYLMT